MSASTKLAAPEQFKVEHRPGRMLDGAMILPDDVVEVFNLAHKDRYFAAGVNRIDRSLVGPALVHDLGQITVRSHCLCQKNASPRPCRALPSAESRRSFAACRQRGRGILPPLTLMYVSSLRQLQATGRFRFCAIFYHRQKKNHPAIYG
jgi:hypothetical protein